MLSDDEFDDVDLKQIKKNFKHHYEGGRNDDGERHGLGSAQFSNGDKYEGQYENGKRHGVGKYTFLNRARYEGEYFDGKRKGKGIMTYPDGTAYNGEWDENKRHGQGLYTYKNGDFYDGAWKEGRKHGKGRYIFAYKGIMYDGMWDYDRFEGEGKLITNGFTFSGVFSEQEPIGDGTITFDNLCAQKGEYVMVRDVTYNKGDLCETFAPKWICTSLVSSAARRDKEAVHLF